MRDLEVSALNPGWPRGPKVQPLPAGAPPAPTRYRPGERDAGSALRAGRGRRNLPAEALPELPRRSQLRGGRRIPQQQGPPTHPAAVSCAGLFRAWEVGGKRRW